MKSLLVAFALLTITTPAGAMSTGPGTWVKVPSSDGTLLGLTRPTNFSDDGQGPLVGYESFKGGGASGGVTEFLFNASRGVTKPLSGGSPVATAPSSLGLRLSPDGKTAFLVASAIYDPTLPPTSGWGVYSEDVATGQMRRLPEFPLIANTVPALAFNADGSCLSEFSPDVPGVLRAMRLKDASIQDLAQTPFHQPTKAPILGVNAASACQEIAFLSPAIDLLPGNFSELAQLFQRSWEAPQLSIGASAIGGEFPNEGIDAAAISADGEHVAFQSTSGDIAAVVGQSDGIDRVFLIDRAVGNTEFVGAMDLLDLSTSGKTVLARSCNQNCTLIIATRDVQAWTSTLLPIPETALYPESAQISGDGRSISVFFRDPQYRSDHPPAMYLFLLAAPLP